MAMASRWQLSGVGEERVVVGRDDVAAGSLITPAAHLGHAAVPSSFRWALRGALGLASLDGGQRETGEVGTAGLLGPAPALVGLQEALWVHFTVEAGQECSPTVRRGLPGITLGVQRVRGEAGAEASLSLASRLVSGAGNRHGALGGLVAHLKLVLSPSSTRGTVGARPGGVVHNSVVVLSTPSGPSRLDGR